MPGPLEVIVEGPHRLAVEAGLHASGTPFRRSCPEELAASIRDGSAGAALVDETALEQLDWRDVNQAADEQPDWSALPVILLSGREAAARLPDLIAALGNVILVELPIDLPLLLHAVRTGLNQRERQRRAGDLLADRARSEARLEEDVRARTADLEQANETLRREIAERLRIERSLRDSEELYRYTVELTDQFAWTASSNLRLETISRGFEGLTGKLRGPDLHEDWLQIVHPDDRDGLMRAWARASEAKRPAEASFRMRLRNGSHRHFRARAAPRLNEAGEVIRWYGFTEDVQEKVDADLARRVAEERYRLAAMATNDAIWELIPDGRTIRWAETAAAALGYEGDLGDTALDWWQERVHPDDRANAVSSLDNALAGQSERWSSTYRFRQASGEYRHYFDRGFIARDERGVAVRVVGAMTDVTEQQSAQEEISRMQAELIHVSRLSAMGTMASTLAHELNQPLTVVTNYLRGIRRLVEREELDVDELRYALVLAESGALRAGQIVRRLRDLVARGTAAMRPEELPKLIDDAGVIAFLDAHLVGVVPQVELDPHARWVEADRIQVQQVIINLVRNAIQAIKMSDRHEIVIRTRRADVQQVQVDVEDSGCGISPEVREALFSPFNSTKPDGMGIGLSISRTIVEAHGGKIWADDRGGGGTIFSFTLPALDLPD